MPKKGKVPGKPRGAGETFAYKVRQMNLEALQALIGSGTLTLLQMAIATSELERRKDDE